jgi:hypothetical protein
LVSFLVFCTIGTVTASDLTQARTLFNALAEENREQIREHVLQFLQYPVVLNDSRIDSLFAVASTDLAAVPRLNPDSRPLRSRQSDNFETFLRSIPKLGWDLVAIGMLDRSLIHLEKAVVATEDLALIVAHERAISALISRARLLQQEFVAERWYSSWEDISQEYERFGIYLPTTYIECLKTIEYPVKLPVIPELFLLIHRRMYIPQADYLERVTTQQ